VAQYWNDLEKLDNHVTQTRRCKRKGLWTPWDKKENGGWQLKGK
jgi:hypothetical protein